MGQPNMGPRPGRPHAGNPGKHWHGKHHHRRHRWYGVPYYGYGSGYYYDDYAYYDDGPDVYVDDGDAVARCASRYRSFDPRTGTYLSSSGKRKICPYLR